MRKLLLQRLVTSCHLPCAQAAATALGHIWISAQAAATALGHLSAQAADTALGHLYDGCELLVQRSARNERCRFS